MSRKSLPWPGADSVLDPLFLESEMRIAALAARRAAAAAQNPPPQPMESRNPLADVLALYTNPPRPPSPLFSIFASSFAPVRKAAQQPRRIPSVAAQDRPPQPVGSGSPLADMLALYTNPPRPPVAAVLDLRQQPCPGSPGRTAAAPDPRRCRAGARR